MRPQRLPPRISLVLLGFIVPAGLFAASDTTPPTLRILSPAPDTEIVGAHLTVELEYNDAGSGIAPESLHVTLNGKDYTGQFDQHSRGADGQIRLPKTLPVGDNRLTVKIADRAGNVARAETAVMSVGPPEEQYKAGLMHAQAGRWKEAAASFERAVKFNPKNVDAHLHLGRSYQHLHRYTEAANAYRTAAELNPHNAEAVKRLGIAYHADGKLPEAKQALQRARRIMPQDAELFYYTGLVELAQKQPLLAELSFKRALLLNLNSPQVYIGLGQAGLDQNRSDKAIEAFTAAIALEPKSAQGRFGLGLAYLARKDKAKAQEQLRLLVEVNKVLSDELSRRLKE